MPVRVTCRVTAPTVSCIFVFVASSISLAMGHTPPVAVFLTLASQFAQRRSSYKNNVSAVTSSGSLREPQNIYYHYPPGITIEPAGGSESRLCSHPDTVRRTEKCKLSNPAHQECQTPPNNLKSPDRCFTMLAPTDIASGNTYSSRR